MCTIWPWFLYIANVDNDDDYDGRDDDDDHYDDDNDDDVNKGGSGCAPSDREQSTPPQISLDYKVHL